MLPIGTNELDLIYNNGMTRVKKTRERRMQKTLAAEKFRIRGPVGEGALQPELLRRGYKARHPLILGSEK